MYKSNIAVLGAVKSVNSTIARLLADKLEMFYLDTDDFIEYELNKKNSETVEELGGDFYVNTEEFKLTKLKNYDSSIISSSPSLMLKNENIDNLLKFCYVVVLTANEELERNRIKREKSYFLKKYILANFDTILKNVKLTACLKADVVADTTGKNKSVVVEEVIEKLKIIIYGEEKKNADI